MNIFSAKISESNSFFDENFAHVEPRFSDAIRFINCFFDEVRCLGTLLVSEKSRKEIVNILANTQWQNSTADLGLRRDEQALALRRLDRSAKNHMDTAYSTHFLTEFISLYNRKTSIKRIDYPLNSENYSLLENSIRTLLIKGLIEIFDSGVHLAFEDFFECLSFDENFMSDFGKTDLNLRAGFLNDLIRLNNFLRSSYSDVSLQQLQRLFSNKAVTDDSSTHINKYRRELTAELFGKQVLCSWHFRYGNSGRAYLGKIPNGLLKGKKLIFRRWGHI